MAGLDEDYELAGKERALVEKVHLLERRLSWRGAKGSWKQRWRSCASRNAGAGAGAANVAGVLHMISATAIDASVHPAQVRGTSEVQKVVHLALSRRL